MKRVPLMTRAPCHTNAWEIFDDERAQRSLANSTRDFEKEKKPPFSVFLFVCHGAILKARSAHGSACYRHAALYTTTHQLFRTGVSA